MTAHFAEVELADTDVGDQIERPFAPSFAKEVVEDGRMSPARGVLLAVLIAAPVWVLVAGAIYVL
jgi:hypothetical protein